MLAQGSHIQIEKIKAAEDPDFRTPDESEYTPGETNPGMSLPVEYTVEGILIFDIALDHSVTIERHTRNGVDTLGFMVTSPVTDIDQKENHTLVTTRNSVYRITENE